MVNKYQFVHNGEKIVLTILLNMLSRLLVMK